MPPSDTEAQTPLQSSNGRVGRRCLCSCLPFPRNSSGELVLPKEPPRPKRDSIDDEVDALLKQLPGADPSLKGDPEEPAARGVAASSGTPPGDAGAAASVRPEPSRRDRVFVWIRVGLGAIIGTAITQWPYLHECGFSLLGFLAALLVIVAAGVWASVWAWKTRMATAHLLALAVTAWGLALVTNQVLSRTGYARARAAWRCPDPTSGLALRQRGGTIGRPDGTRLRYRDIGSGSVSLIAAGAMVLTDFLRPLMEQQRVVLYDPRHRGASRPVSDTAGVGIEGEVDDLAAVRQHFAAVDFAVLGWSHTGATVARFAALRPDIVTRVVLIAPIPPRRASYRVDWSRGTGQDSLGLELLRIMRMRGEDRTNPTDFCRRYWEIAVLGPWMGDAAALERSTMDPCRFENEQPKRREASLARLFDAFGNWDWTSNVGDFAGPVLVIHGTADPFPIEGAAEWIQSFPNARLLSIDGAGHIPWLEQPDVVYGAIEKFLGGEWPEGAVGR